MMINGVRHWYRRAGVGDGVPLVIVHGGPGGFSYDFEKVTGPVLEARRPVIYYEQRGCGRSDPPADGDYSLATLVDDLEQLRVGLGLARMALLGISFGGQLAAEYAVAHPDRVAALILHGFGAPGPLAASPQPAGFDAVADPVVRQRIRAAGDAYWDVVDRRTTDAFLFHQPGTAELVRGLWDESGLVNTGAMAAALGAEPPRAVPLIDELAELDLPTLILIGLWDRNAGVDACRDLATRLRRAELVVFEDSAHFPNIEETERYVDAIADFLGRGAG